ncbi:peptide-methionine (R)-S-oxide reductase [Flavobacterium swingsii]|uniref:peptide-methionine (R)-S-oxide reductase n=1 Tax=Flavobacterium swingsii TaxID=498292 RepID=A0A1I0UYI8_9FLAO|nr:peptide-methionine (R)-S-oxide reductase MsrB [Flavobacterium swingsii]SFA68930.1 peptide-methionine (R)-S-oxide reductase [Flavobacterium swingsii]
MKKTIFLLAFILSLASCHSQEKKTEKVSPKNKISKTDAQWKTELTPEQYQVLRNKGTEASFSGKYWNHFEKGYYACVACKNPLFTSDAKFNSECGWPSFDQAIKGSVIYKDDSTFGMQRTEVMCSNCNGHLGHVFDDGPSETTGKRFCTNSVSILFIPKKKK